jgi:putative transcription factor
MPICEICGNTFHGEFTVIKLDGALMKVCRSCGKLGTPATLPRIIKRPILGNKRSKITLQSNFISNEVVELRKDYPYLIKRTREKIGLSQEALGRRINEKLSLIKLLETGKLRPNDSLAKKIEHALKIELLIPIEEE